MDFDLGDQAAALRHRLRELIATHVAEDYLGAFTDDPADLDVAQRFCKLLAAEGLLTVAWPSEYGGGGGSLWEQTVRARGDVGPPRAPGRPVHGAQLGRAGDHGVRQRRAEAAPPAPDRRRRRDLVPGLQRARGRQRPRRPAHPGPRGRRRLAHRGPEDLDLLRRHGAVVRARRPGRARRAPRGHHAVPRPDGHAGHHRAPDPFDARPPPPQRGVLRRRVGRPRRRAGRRSAGAGR